MKNKTNMFLKGMLGRFSATVMLFAVGCIAAFADNKLYIEDFTIAPGQTKTLEILLENESPVSSLQFIATLPEGLEYVDNSFAKVTNRITRSSHSVTVQKGENAFRVIVLSTSSKIENSSIKGKSGAILTVDVKAATDYKGGVIVIDDIVGSDANNRDENGVPYSKHVDIESTQINAIVHVGDAVADAEEVTVRPNVLTHVGVSFNNDIDIVGLQAVVTLPEGVSFVEDEDGEVITYSNRLSGNTVATVSELEGEPNKYTLLISSLTSDVFEGAEGNLFSLNVAASKPLEGEIVISDIKVSSDYAVSYDLDNTLTVKIKCVTDPTGDGMWDIDDVTAVIKVLNSSEVDSVCDLNGDGVVDIDDVLQTIKESNK